MKDKLPLERRRTLSLHEIEELYGVPYETLRRWIRREERRDGCPPLKAFKAGKSVMVFRDVFENYLKQFPVSA